MSVSHLSPITQSLRRLTSLSHFVERLPQFLDASPNVCVTSLRFCVSSWALRRTSASLLEHFTPRFSVTSFLLPPKCVFSLTFPPTHVFVYRLSSIALCLLFSLSLSHAHAHFPSLRFLKSLSSLSLSPPHMSLSHPCLLSLSPVLSVSHTLIHILSPLRFLVGRGHTLASAIHTARASYSLLLGHVFIRKER